MNLHKNRIKSEGGRLGLGNIATCMEARGSDQTKKQYIETTSQYRLFINNTFLVVLRVHLRLCVTCISISGRTLRQGLGLGQHNNSKCQHKMHKQSYGEVWACLLR